MSAAVVIGTLRVKTENRPKASTMYLGVNSTGKDQDQHAHPCTLIELFAFTLEM